jgi:uncharacterized membrane protein
MDTVIAKYHLHPIIDHFTIALLAKGIITDVVGYIIALLFRDKSPTIQSLAERLRRSRAYIARPGRAVGNPFAADGGESEAERVWESISPVAQQILLSDSGSARFLSHAVLGTYLMYVFVVLVGWRTLLESWTTLKQTRLLYFGVAVIALCVLLYQGRTGGELVYDHGARTTHAQTTSQQH